MGRARPVDVWILDITAPGAGFVAALLDEALEPLQVTGNSTGHEAEFVTDGLNHTLRIVFKLERHPCFVRIERMEGNDAGIVGARRIFPGDTLVRVLLGDYGIPFLSLAGDRRLPVQAP